MILNGKLTIVITIGSVLKTSKWHYLVFYVLWIDVERLLFATVYTRFASVYTVCSVRSAILG